MYTAQSFNHQILLEQNLFSDSIYFFKELYEKIMDLNNEYSTQMQEDIYCKVYSVL